VSLDPLADPHIVLEGPLPTRSPHPSLKSFPLFHHLSLGILHQLSHVDVAVVLTPVVERALEIVPRFRYFAEENHTVFCHEELQIRHVDALSFAPVLGDFMHADLPDTFSVSKAVLKRAFVGRSVRVGLGHFTVQAAIG
jgi:hypothetical protein